MSLVEAIQSLQGDEPVSVESIRILHTATRDDDARPTLLSSDIFEAALRQLDTLQQKVSEASCLATEMMLRCIGNLITFQSENAAILAKNSITLNVLGDLMCFEIAGEQDCNYKRAYTAICVVHNMCCSDESAVASCLDAGLDENIIRHIESCLFLSKSDEVDVPIQLLGDLTSALKEKLIPRQYDAAFAIRMLRVAQSEDLDGEAFFSFLEAILPYLADQTLQQVLLDNDMVKSAFEVLERSVLLLPDFSENDDTMYSTNLPCPPTHHHVGKKSQGLLMHHIVDISHLPDWPATFTADSDFTTLLLEKCVLTDNDADNALLASCACTLVANYALNDDAARYIADHIKLESIYTLISLKAYNRSRTSSAGFPDQTGYLWLITGLLRHLSRDPVNKKKHFADSTSKQAAMSLVQYNSSDVQAAGLGLLRQIMFDDPRSLDEIATAGFLVVLTRLFVDETTEPKVKLEISRTVTAIIRSIRVGETSNEAVTSALETRDLYAPLEYVIKTAPVPLALAEAYSGLCLAIRKSPLAVKVIGQIYQTDDSLRDALSKHLSGEEKDASEAGAAESSASDIEQSLPIQGSKTGVAQSMNRQVRDNGTILLSELLKYDGLDHDLRDQLDTIAGKAGITLMLGPHGGE